MGVCWLDWDTLNNAILYAIDQPKTCDLESPALTSLHNIDWWAPRKRLQGRQTKVPRMPKQKGQITHAMLCSNIPEEQNRGCSINLGGGGLGRGLDGGLDGGLGRGSRVNSGDFTFNKQWFSGDSI